MLAKRVRQLTVNVDSSIEMKVNVGIVPGNSVGEMGGKYLIPKSESNC